MILTAKWDKKDVQFQTILVFTYGFCGEIEPSIGRVPKYISAKWVELDQLVLWLNSSERSGSNGFGIVARVKEKRVKVARTYIVD